MGRRPKTPGAIPRFRVRKKPSGNVCYYYDHGGRPRKETPLGSNYGDAIKRWAEIEHASEAKLAEIITFRFVCNRYRVEVIPTKAERTRKDNGAEIEKLLEYFDDPPAALDKITPASVRQFLTWRSATAKVRAIREKALLSHIWNWARGKGYTEKPNPCEGIRSVKPKGRDVYVEDDAFDAIHAAACAHLRDAMDLLYLTGQRPSDVLRASEHDIRDGALHFRQSKTGARVPMEITAELAAVLERIRQRKQGHSVYCTRLVVNDYGRPVSLAMLQRAFVTAREAAGITGVQLRDLRAKAGTDKAESSGDVRQAQRQLGHSSVVMTEQYIRNRKGAKTTPTR